MTVFLGLIIERKIILSKDKIDAGEEKSNMFL
jgi:hypothetical protein